MQNELMPSHGVMEGGGAYNLHSLIPPAGSSLALPLLEQAVRNIPLGGGNEPVVIADYGSSQGKNSLAPMRTAISALRARLGPDRPISVVHTDQAANDFNTLFDVLHTDPDRYASDDPNVFPSAIGRSFYEQILPPDHVHLGWSSYAAMWLSRIPTRISGHFLPARTIGADRAAFEQQAAKDWETFLSLRARELRPGGRLVIVLAALDDDGSQGPGLVALMDHANQVLAEMADEGAITPAERASMVLGTYLRRRRDLQIPFAHDGQFRGLVVERCDLLELPDAAWADYEQDGNRQVLATRHARFFRSIFAPSLATALNGDGAASGAFAVRLEDGLKRRLQTQPVPLHSFAQTMVLAKQSARA
jgi:hypothetical protein